MNPVPSPDAAPLRVVQWATGNIGTRALRAVVEHPALALVGLYVHSDGKAGRDAGELCGLPATGVTATRDIEDVVALGADCVLYMPLVPDLDEVCRLLESGADVVTTAGLFHHPAGMDPAVRERVEAACEKGRSSVHSTGSSPGFISEAVPLALMSIQTRLDSLTINEYANMSSRNSPAMLFDVMGFGRRESEFDPRRAAHLGASFGPSLRQLADALSAPLDAVEATGEIGIARRTVEIAAGTLEAGTLAAQRVSVCGLRGGKPLLRFVANWYCTTELEQDWDLRPTGWRVTVDGDAPLDVDLRFDVPMERMAATTPGYTAHRAVNAVPVVCAAPPGIRTTADLPQITANLG
jgi:4-hydroxy-tetrahydrodipicolinate reductase